jgi:hypothetical protein
LDDSFYISDKIYSSKTGLAFSLKTGLPEFGPTVETLTTYSIKIGPGNKLYVKEN